MEVVNMKKYVKSYKLHRTMLHYTNEANYKVWYVRNTNTSKYPQADKNKERFNDKTL